LTASITDERRSLSFFLSGLDLTEDDGDEEEEEQYLTVEGGEVWKWRRERELRETHLPWRRYVVMLIYYTDSFFILLPFTNFSKCF
jgi:hypothetical protein